MQRVRIAELFRTSDEFDGLEVTVAGWVRSIRDMKNFGFATINDGTCFKDLQVVLERETLDCYDTIASQNVGAALIARGTLVRPLQTTQREERGFYLLVPREVPLSAAGALFRDWGTKKRPAYAGRFFIG